MTRRLERTTRRLPLVRARVADELSKNVLWRFVVDERFWLCPYCGMVGANLESGRDRVELVTFHLLRQCTHFEDFESTYVTRDLLRARAIEVLAGWKLTHDSGWRFFDDLGRWFCPFCAHPQAVPGLRTEEGLRELKRVATLHLKGCPAFDEGRGTPLAPEELSHEVVLETRIHRLAEQVRHQVGADPSWIRATPSGHAICPYCFRALLGVDASTPFIARETAPGGLARHLTRECEVYPTIEPAAGQPAHVLRPAPAQPDAEFFTTIPDPTPPPVTSEPHVRIHSTPSEDLRRITL